MDKKVVKVDTVSTPIDVAPLALFDVLAAGDRAFRLFLPTLLFSHGAFDRDPVVEFASYYSERFRRLPFCVDIAPTLPPLFSGFPVAPGPRSKKVVDWNRRLYIVEEESYEDCFAFIGGMAWLHRGASVYTSVFHYDATVPDPTAPSRSLSLRIFGVLGSDFVAYVDVAAPVPRALKVFTPDPLGYLTALGADTKESLAVKAVTEMLKNDGQTD